MDAGLGAETGEPVRVEQPPGFSHAAIMAARPAQENAKTPGKNCQTPSILGAIYPHDLEKSLFFRKMSPVVLDFLY
jgi:hypothetical protein